MDTDADRDQNVRRIVLPSGKTIEVLRVLEDVDGATGDRGAEVAPPPPSGSDLATDAASRGDAPPAQQGDPHLCPECQCSLVYPVAWTAAGEESWRVELRCPNCERTTPALLDLEIAERFDEELERGAEVLMSDLARLTEANMREDLERFAAALRADAILPVDF